MAKHVRHMRVLEALERRAAKARAKRMKRLRMAKATRAALRNDLRSEQARRELLALRRALAPKSRRGRRGALGPASRWQTAVAHMVPGKWYATKAFQGLFDDGGVAGVIGMSGALGDAWRRGAVERVDIAPITVVGVPARGGPTQFQRTRHAYRLTAKGEAMRPAILAKLDEWRFKGSGGLQDGQ